MAPLSVAQIIEYREIHLAVCRWRRQGVCCSTCTQLCLRVDRALARHGTNLPLAS